MGLFDKLKNMFTEEEEEELEEKEPIKKEVFQVEIPAPKIEEKKEEVETIKKEEKFVFPVYFDDTDFEEKPKKPTNFERQVPKRSDYEKRREVPKEEPRKRFKLSPVISPVYGILDKNYKKDDIIEKKSTSETIYHESAALKVDRIRKKAYGTLEDELENGLDEVKIEQTVTKNVKNELENEATGEIEDMFFDKDFDKDMTLEEAIKKYEPKEAEKIEDKDDLIESDLFNLIDSMYDKNPKEDINEWNIINHNL